MKAVILVGGEGTRLRPITVDLPKPLASVANRPFLEHVLAHLGAHGVTEAILTTGYRADAFDTFSAERTHGVRLTVVREAEPLDTCGAVRNVEHLLDGTFLVCNGDILTDLDVTALVAHHRERRAVATLTLAPVEDPSAYGLVPIDTDGRIERFIEKPRPDEIATDLVNAGTYVLEPEALDPAPAGQRYSFERGLFPALLAAQAPLYGFRWDGYWLDVGTPRKYIQANLDVLARRVGLEPEGHDHRADTAVGPGCRIAAGASLDSSVLHADVEVAEDCVVERSVLCRGCRIGPRTVVADAVVGADARIGADNELRAGIRIWPGVDVPNGALRFS